MRYLLSLLCLCLITWQTQGTLEELSINDELDDAISNTEAILNEHIIDSQAAESNDVYQDPSEDSYNNGGASPVNGNFSIWHAGQCTKKCGGGVETDTRSCDNPLPANGGHPCVGCVARVKTCNTDKCPVDGGWSKWIKGKCPCGAKTTQRRRTCSKPKPAYGGNDCAGSAEDTVPCPVNPCPIDGNWNSWTKSECTKTCGGGKTTRTRSCSNPKMQYKGKDCVGDASVTEACNIQLCPVDGNWGTWGPYSKCSKTCARGSTWRKRKCDNPAQANGGKECVGKNMEDKDCMAHPCPKFSCLKPMDFVILLDYSRKSAEHWKTEVKFAENMVDTIFRKFSDAKVSLILFGALNRPVAHFTGVALYLNLKKTFRLLEKHDPTSVKNAKPESEMGFFTAFEEIKKHGRSKAPKAILLITNGYTASIVGKAIKESAIKEMKAKLLKIHAYTTVVGIGFDKLKTASKALAMKAIMAIASSKEHVFTRSYAQLLSKVPHKNPIHASFCAVNGEWTSWSEGKCSKTCGSGTKIRSRSCTDPAPKSGGKKCTGRNTDNLVCKDKECPVDCHWTTWTETTCTKTCGAGQKTRTRTAVGPKFGGKACKGKEAETVECTIKPCPIDGQWSPWSSTTCSKSCGGGEITKSRACTNPKPEHEGKECPGMKKEIIVCNEKKCPIDGNWSGWKQGACSKSCGGGKLNKVRKCDNPKAQYGGEVCPGDALNVITCNNDPCPIDGGWSSWSEGTCTKKCGGGKQTFSRTCTKPKPQHKGKACSTAIDGASKDVDCNIHKCPIDGNWGSWKEGACSKTCGGGKKTRTRNCDNPKPQYEGKDCDGKENEELSCKEDACPVDGNWSEYKPFSKCSKECGGGKKTRVRTCTNPKPAHRGKKCFGAASDTANCNEKPCPVEGNWGSWKEGKCSKTCGDGKKTNTRKCNNPVPAHGGKECPGDKTKTLACNEKECPVNGKWTSWSETPCSKTCGGGKKTRTRTCTKPAPAHGGKKCSGLEKIVDDCQTQACPVDGKWSAWSDAVCNKKCDGGTKTRQRKCNNPAPQHGGKKCAGLPFHAESCNEHPCPKYICNTPLDLIIALDYSNSLTQSSWKKQVSFAGKLLVAAFREHPQVKVGILHFGNKAVVDLTLRDSAGSFTKIRNKLRSLAGIFPAGGSKQWTRTDLALSKALAMFNGEKRNGANKILAVLTDGYAAGPQGALANAALAAGRAKLVKIGAHVLAVGFGFELIITEKHKKMASANLDNLATHKDMKFLRSFQQLLDAAKVSELTKALCPINGGHSAWKEKGACSKTCGGGEQKFTRTCSVPPAQFHGKPCTGAATKTEPCNKDPCPIDGNWSDWKITKCTKTCGGGTKVKSRTCTNPAPKYNGKSCPGKAELKESCNAHNCPIDGGWSDWKAGACTKTCGGGKETLTRTCTKPKPEFKGKICVGPKTKQVDCKTEPCPIDGNWAAWKPVSKCTKSCGGGDQVYERTCTNPAPQYNGKVCEGGNKKTETCNKDHCPIDGVWTSWTATACSKKCGGGLIKRQRSCTNPPPQYNGKSCVGAETDASVCNAHNCPIDGGWTDWKKGTCSKSCGKGVLTISRECKNPAPQYKGKDCVGEASKQEQCNPDPCPIDGNWSPWIPEGCSRTCGGGVKNYVRTCTKPAPKYKGKFCVGEPKKQDQCNTEHCPIDGNWVAWSQWSSCTKTCGGGEQTRKRSCTNPEPKYDGKTCEGEISQVAECNTRHCPPPCDIHGCTNCKCHGKQYAAGEGFISHNCQERCTCSSTTNKMECKALCPYYALTACTKNKTLYYESKPVGKSDYNSKSCHCYKPTCVSGCPKANYQPISAL